MTNFAFASVEHSNLVNFSSLYQLAFIIPFLILLIVGIRKKYDMSRWLTILLVSAFCMLLGSRISTFSLSEWSELFRNGVWPESYEKFALGGLALALVGIYLSKRALGFDQPVLKIFAWVAPIGLAIQKVGCLFSGCCYGISTTLPWGVKYTTEGFGFPGHGIDGMVHPTQIYQVLIYLSIAAAVLIFIKRFKRDESVICFALTLLFGSRFLLELLIDPLATNIGGSIFLGLKKLQWIMIAGFLLSLAYLILTEKRLIVNRRMRPVQQGMKQPIMVFLVISILFVLVQHAFTFNESFAFNIRFTVITIMFGVILLTQLSPPRLRWLSPAILVLPLFLLSQTVQYKLDGFEKERVFSAGTGIGEYYNQLRYNPRQATGCDGDQYTAYDRVTFENSHFTGSLGYGIEARRDKYESYRYGANIQVGSVSERREDIPISNSLLFAAVHPYAEYSRRWIGIGANLNLGYFPALLVTGNDSPYMPDENHKLHMVLPGFSARFGPYDILDIRVRFASGFPSMLPSHLWDFSTGTGFGMKNGSGIRVGTTWPMEESIFFEGNLRLKKLDLYLRYMYRENYFHTANDENNNEFNVGVSYRIPIK